MSKENDLEIISQRLIKGIEETWPPKDIAYETIARAEDGAVFTEKTLAKIGHILQGEVTQTSDSDLLSTWAIDKGDYKIALSLYKAKTPYTVTGEAGVIIFQRMSQTARNPLKPIYTIGGISAIEIPQTLDPNFVRFSLHTNDVTASLSVHRNGTVSQQVDQRPLKRGR